MTETTTETINSPVKLEPLTIGGLEVDVAMIDGEPWIYAPELAITLGYRDARDMLRGDGDDERRKCAVITAGGVQVATLLNEPHFYRVVLRSRSKVAERFKAWLFKDALPEYSKSNQAKMRQQAEKLGVTLEFTETQWEWLNAVPYYVDIIPLALAGYDSMQISKMLNYKTVGTGITARKQIERLKALGILPKVIEPRIKRLERQIKAEMAAKLAG